MLTTIVASLIVLLSIGISWVYKNLIFIIGNNYKKTEYKNVDVSELPEWILQFHQSVEKEFSEYGFEFFTVTQNEDNIADLKYKNNYSFVYFNSETSTFITTSISGHSKKSTIFEVYFSTFLNDGKIIETYNFIKYTIHSECNTNFISNRKTKSIEELYKEHLNNLGKLSNISKLEITIENFKEEYITVLNRFEEQRYKDLLKSKKIKIAEDGNHYLGFLFALNLLFCIKKMEFKIGLSSLGNYTLPLKLESKRFVNYLFLKGKYTNHPLKTGYTAIMLILLLICMLVLSKYNFIKVGFFVILFHELSHSIVLKFFKIRDERILFLPLFSSPELSSKNDLADWKKAVIYFAGAVPGLSLGLLLLTIIFIFENTFISEPVFKDLAMGLIFLNVLSLIPLEPFDGGKIFNMLFFPKFRKSNFFINFIVVVTLVGLEGYTKSKIFILTALLIMIVIFYRLYIEGLAGEIVKNIRKYKTKDLEGTAIRIFERLNKYSKNSLTYKRKIHLAERIESVTFISETSVITTLFVMIVYALILPTTAITLFLWKYNPEILSKIKYKEETIYSKIKKVKIVSNMSVDLERYKREIYKGGLIKRFVYRNTVLSKIFGYKDNGEYGVGMFLGKLKYLYGEPEIYERGYCYKIKDTNNNVEFFVYLYNGNACYGSYETNENKIINSLIGFEKLLSKHKPVECTFRYLQINYGRKHLRELGVKDGKDFYETVDLFDENSIKFQKFEKPFLITYNELGKMVDSYIKFYSIYHDKYLWSEDSSTKMVLRLSNIRGLAKENITDIFPAIKHEIYRKELEIVEESKVKPYTSGLFISKDKNEISLINGESLIENGYGKNPEILNNNQDSKVYFLIRFLEGEYSEGEDDYNKFIVAFKGNSSNGKIEIEEAGGLLTEYEKYDNLLQSTRLFSEFENYRFENYDFECKDKAEAKKISKIYTEYVGYEEDIKTEGKKISIFNQKIQDFGWAAAYARYGERLFKP